MLKFQSAFQSYIERASRQYQSRESLLLQENRVRIPILQIFKKLFDLNAKMSPEIQTNNMVKETADLKQLCIKLERSCNDLNNTVKAGHPDKKSISSSFQSVQNSIQNVEHLLVELSVNSGALGSHEPCAGYIWKASSQIIGEVCPCLLKTLNGIMTTYM